MKAVKVVQERLAAIAQAFLADRVQRRGVSRFSVTGKLGKTDSECKMGRSGKKNCCRDKFESENPSVIFIEPIYSENTYNNLKSAF